MIYFHIGEERYGPFDESELRKLPKNVVKPGHYVSVDDGPVRRADETEEIRFLFVPQNPDLSESDPPVDGFSGQKVLLGILIAIIVLLLGVVAVNEIRSRNGSENPNAVESQADALNRAWKKIRRLPDSEFAQAITLTEEFLERDNPKNLHREEAEEFLRQKILGWDRADYEPFYKTATDLRSDLDLEEAATAGKRYLSSCNERKKFDIPSEYAEIVRKWLHRFEEIKKNGCELEFRIRSIEVSNKIKVERRGIQILLALDDVAVLDSAGVWIAADMEQPNDDFVLFSDIPKNLAETSKNLRWDASAKSSLIFCVYTDRYGSKWRPTGFYNMKHELVVAESRFPLIHLNTPNDRPLELKDNRNHFNVRVRTELNGLDFPVVPSPNSGGVPPAFGGL